MKFIRFIGLKKTVLELSGKINKKKKKKISQLTCSTPIKLKPTINQYNIIEELKSYKL